MHNSSLFFIVNSVKMRANEIESIRCHCLKSLNVKNVISSRAQELRFFFTSKMKKQQQ